MDDAAAETAVCRSPLTVDKVKGKISDCTCPDQFLLFFPGQYVMAEQKGRGEASDTENGNVRMIDNGQDFSGLFIFDQRLVLFTGGTKRRHMKRK